MEGYHIMMLTSHLQTTGPFALARVKTLRAVQLRSLVNQEASNKGDDDKEDAEAPCGQPLNSCQARFSLERLKDVYKMKEAVLQGFAWMLTGQCKGGHSASASRWHDIYLLCLQEKDEMDAFLDDIKDVEDKASPQLKRSVVGTVKVQGGWIWCIFALETFDSLVSRSMTIWRVVSRPVRHPTSQILTDFNV